MAKLYLIRHGEAAAGWADDLDPGLSALGCEQAAKVAERFASLPPLQMLSSPMRRTRETAAPLMAVWKLEPTIEPGVSEIPSPTEDLDERTKWLRAMMPGNWGGQDPSIQAWRANVVRALTDLPQDTVVFTHFIAINAAVGAATGSDKVTVFRPDNCSVTVLRSVADELQLLELGAEGETRVN
jgi:broad specificity phosphatase PhoE